MNKVTVNNPLLKGEGLPNFSGVNPEHIVPAIELVIAEHREVLSQLLKKTSHTWRSFLLPLQVVNVRLGRVSTIVSHLNSVVNTPSLQSAYQVVLTKLTQYHAQVSQSQDVFKVLLQISQDGNFSSLPQPQKRVVEIMLRNARLAGVSLPEAERKTIADLSTKLSQLSNQFSQNVLDSTQAWFYITEDKTELTGIPEHIIQAASLLAQEENQSGWKFTMGMSTYIAVMTNAQSTKLREVFYHAFVTKASDKFVLSSKWDNTVLMADILMVREQIANMLGFKTYADYSVETKMVVSAQAVIDFLDSLVARSLPKAQKEFIELEKFSQTCGVKEKHIQPWDMMFYAEKLRRKQYEVSQEQLREYFPLGRVLTGLFSLVNELYSIEFNIHEKVNTWHDDVQCYVVKEAGKAIGYVYCDLYSRKGKQAGAWVNDFQPKYSDLSGDVELPIVFLVCNFLPPASGQPCLLTHQEVTTLFHEFGHCLHHLLSEVDCVDVSGLNGVAWDAVEVPSQFMEQWCWDWEVVQKFAYHYKTGERLPEELFSRLLASRNFHAGFAMVKQLEYALFDFWLHRAEVSKDSVEKTLRRVRSEISVVQAPEYNRFAHSFSHIFAGGYAAGYYSYKWSEMIACDVFTCFSAEGSENDLVGARFRSQVLSQGGAVEAEKLYAQFLGRKPSLDAMLAVYKIE